MNSILSPTLDGRQHGMLPIGCMRGGVRPAGRPQQED